MAFPQQVALVFCDECLADGTYRESNTICDCESARLTCFGCTVNLLAIREWFCGQGCGRHQGYPQSRDWCGQKSRDCLP